MSYEELAALPGDSEQVKELKRQVMNLTAQLEIQKERMHSLKGGYLLNSEAIDLYPGEQLDFVLSILEQAREKCAPESRPRDILDSILSVNKPVGKGKEILEAVEKIFKQGEPKSEATLSALKNLGFTYVSSKKHPKLRFFDRYTFVLCRSPSDGKHGVKNLLSDISKCIAVSQKI